MALAVALGIARGYTPPIEAGIATGGEGGLVNTLRINAKNPVMLHCCWERSASVHHYPKRAITYAESIRLCCFYSACFVERIIGSGNRHI